MKRKPSLDKRAGVTVRRAQSEMNALRAELKSLRAKLTNTRMSATPAIRAARTKTKKTRHDSAWSGAGLGDIAQDLLTLGYASATQSASASLTDMLVGQRIR